MTSSFYHLKKSSCIDGRPGRRCGSLSRMTVDPTGADIRRFIDEDDGGPVVMLNLLRFKPDGRESYARYAEALGDRFLARYGAELLYAGQGSTVLAAEPGQEWDMVLLVRYPSREAFSRMVADPEYQEVAHLRSQALVEAVLQATVPVQVVG